MTYQAFIRFPIFDGWRFVGACTGELQSVQARAVRSVRSKKRHVPTERCRMGRRVAIQMINTYDLVVGTRRQVAAVWRESDRVDGA